MNRKKFITSWLAAFVTVFVFEWLFHGKFLASTYQATASLWRSEADMKQLFHWLLIAQFLATGMFAYIFTKGYEAKGLAEGFRYGLSVD